ncbi:MAG: tetratricopeptide repeat protein [Planctomycetaceae bacterium]|nr:tetratricopeptide repeat protein [Planctomycetaceae bacterium]
MTFLPCLRGRFLNFDDDGNFLANPHYRGLGLENLKWMFTDHAGHYIPLTWMTLGLDYVLWGMNPLGYHLTNVLLHALNAALCFFVFDGLLRRARPGEDPASRAWIAAAGALLFSLHPLRVESVAWITERRDVLCGAFFLLSLLAYLRSIDDPSRRKWLGLSLAAFAGSMLSKTLGMTLPVVLVLIDAWPLGRFRRERPTAVLIEKLPFVALMLTAAAVSAWAEHAVKAVYSVQDYPLVQSLAQPGYRISFYVRKMLFPAGLSPLYFYRPELGMAHVAGWAAVLAATGAAAVSVRRFPELTVAWFSFLLLIFPASGVVQVGPHFAADRYTYLACLPLTALAVGALTLPTGRGRRVGAGVMALLLAGLAALSVRQCGVWRDSLTLWDRAIALEPDVYYSLKFRGSARLEASDPGGALADFSRAIELRPGYPESWYGRGITRAGLGDHAGAVEDLTTALQLAPGKEGTLSARAVSRARLGDKAGAREDIDQAAALAPDSFQVRMNRGLVRSLTGDPAGAEEDYTRALQISPEAAVAWYNRGLARARLGRGPEAVQDFDRAIALQPVYPEALAQRGVTRTRMKDPAGGIADLTESLRLKPDPATFLLRASARAIQSDFQGALQDCDEAVRRSPDSPDAHTRRGAVRLELGDGAGASEDLQKALQLAPPGWAQRRQVEELLQRAATK